MASPPPRLAPTLVLAAAWLAVYLLWLAVRPQPPAGVERPRSTTSTTAEQRKAVRESWLPARSTRR